MKWLLIKLICLSESVNSEGFKETLSYCDEVLRLRSINGTPSNLVDATLMYWLSGNPNTPRGCIEGFPQSQSTGFSRPLLRALLFHLSTRPPPSSSSADIPEKAMSSTSSFLPAINLIDRCLWLLLQTGSSSSSFYLFNFVLMLLNLMFP